MVRPKYNNELSASISMMIWGIRVLMHNKSETISKLQIVTYDGDSFSVIAQRLLFSKKGVRCVSVASCWHVQQRTGI
jgi:hypothetical protein